MPNYSGKWNLQGQLQGIKAGTWTGISSFELYSWGANDQGQLGTNTASTVDVSSPVQIGELSDWSTVSAGARGKVVTALKTDGTLWSWGENGQGQSGVGDAVNRSSPVQIGSETYWTSATSANNHAGAVNASGELYMWGDNSWGQLGTNTATTVDASSPVQVGSLTNWSFFGGGQTDSFALKTDGTLWSWGINSTGELGTNDRTNRSSPVQIGAETDWTTVSASTNLSAAINSSGELYTWGSGSTGSTGHGDAIARSSPTQVGALTDWAKVSAGGLNFCLAVKTDGTLWAWGSGSEGKLGNNLTTAYRSSPIQIGALTNWQDVSAGERHSAAIKTDGTLWAWGRGEEGRLGDGTILYRSSPVQVGSLTNWSQVTSGGNFTVAISEERTGM